MVDLVVELIQIDVVQVFVDLAVNLYFVPGQHACQLHVVAALTDSQTHLVRFQIYLCRLVLLVDLHRTDLGGSQSTLDIEVDVRGVVDHVDVLVAQLAYDTMDSRTFHTYTCAYRVDALVEGLYRHFGALTRDTGDLLDSYQTFLHLRYLLFEQTLQEQRSRTAQDDLRLLVLVLHLDHYGTDHVALAVEISRNLVLLRQVELVALLVQKKHLFLPYLIQLSGNHLTQHVFVFLVQRLFLQLHDFRRQGLAEIQDHTPSERSEGHLIRHVVTHLGFLVQQTGVAQRDLRIRIGYIAVFHYQTVAVDLQVTLVRVDDDRVVG